VTDSDNSLQAWVAHLVARLREAAERLSFTVPDWGSVVVGTEVNRRLSDEWVPLEDGEPLFQEAASTAPAGLIILRAEGVRDGALHVVISYNPR